MFLSGAAIGTDLIIMLIHHKQIQKVLLPARPAFCVVAVGSATLRPAAFLVAASTPPAAAAATAVFGWFVPFSL